MNLRTTKPIHVRCPKCGHDITVNSKRIEEDYEAAKLKIQSIKSEMARAKEEGAKKDSPRWKRLVRLYDDTNLQLQAIKKARKSIGEEAELQRYRAFKDLVVSEIGEKRTIQLLEEAEDDMKYNDYETAIQKYNRFNGV